jgi:glutathione synthase/RimK-type ligase-like ATP-grasp enzyme
MTRRCAYLTMDEEPDWSNDADLLVVPMRTLDWQTEAVRWRAEGTDWNRFDAVYIGAAWDYPQDPQRFIRLLETIDQSSALLVNDIALVRWTMAKTYLRDLERRGVPIVPTLWGDEISSAMLRDTFDAFAVDSVIVKPVISTNATDTFLLSRESLENAAERLVRAFNSRAFMVQPFIDNIRSEGEYSLFYFNRRLSHAVRKVPQSGDFRVQEDFGATIVPAQPEPDLKRAGDAAMCLVEPMPAYARVDFVRGPDGQFLLMELELIEPSLYLAMEESAPQRFADALDEYVRQS